MTAVAPLDTFILDTSCRLAASNTSVPETLSTPMSAERSPRPSLAANGRLQTVKHSATMTARSRVPESNLLPRMLLEHRLCLHFLNMLFNAPVVPFDTEIK